MKSLSFLLVLSVATVPNVSTNTLKNVGCEGNITNKIIIKIEKKDKILVPISTIKNKPPDIFLKKYIYFLFTLLLKIL